MKTKKTKYYILGGILVLVLVGVGIGLSMYYKPHKDFAHAGADIVIKAGDLCAEFCADEAAANAKFVADNKTIQVSGIVRDLSKNQDGSWSIVLNTNDASCTINCTLMPDESHKAEKLHAGASVKLQGQCTGMQELIDKQVIMIRCGLAGN
jgi:hypothetical protein